MPLGITESSLVLRAKHSDVHSKLIFQMIMASRNTSFVFVPDYPHGREKGAVKSSLLVNAFESCESLVLARNNVEDGVGYRNLMGVVYVDGVFSNSSIHACPWELYQLVCFCKR